MPKKIFILGAGLAGLSAAWHLQKKGFECHVFEKEADIGGLCRSKKVDGFIFDYDGHLLHFKHRPVFSLIKGLLGDNLVRHKRNSWVYSHGTYIRYPFQANLHGLPADIVKECLLGFIKSSGRNLSPGQKKANFLEWIIRTFGNGIARHFMIPYNTKFWTIPPEQMNCEWLDSFIPVPSLSQLVEGTVKDSSRQFGYNTWFWYPKKGGISQLPLALASGLKNVHTGCRITRIDCAKKELEINSSNREKFDYIIYTLPLPEIPNLIKGLPSGVASLFNRLRWNSIFNLNLGINRKDMSKRHWVYFPQKDVCFFRVGFPGSFAPHLTPAGKSSLYVEVSYSKDNPIKRNKIIASIKKDLKKVGLLEENDRICCQDVNDIEYGYPIYDTNYNKTQGEIVKYLSSLGMIPCGRYGSWRYLPIEDTILDGKRAAESLVRIYLGGNKQ